MSELPRLSNREWDVLKLLLEGKSNKLIAASLDISVRTVEFHLKNIYAKFQVSSRIELILKLGKAAGGLEVEKLGYSTVASKGEAAENRDRLNSWMSWAASFRDTVSMIGKELQMRNLMNTRHVPVGVVTALFTGFVWVAMLRYFAHMSSTEINPWLVPLMIVWVIIGLTIGLVGKRNGSTALKIWFSTLFGTGLSPISILPLMGLVVLPLGKLVERLGLINRATMSSDMATTLAIIAMLALWMTVGIVIGIMLLFITIKKSEHKNNQIPVTDTRL